VESTGKLESLISLTFFRAFQLSSDTTDWKALESSEKIQKT
jgi:hypothetical protein